MRTRRVAEIVGDARGVGDDLRQVRILGVEDAQWIGVQPTPGVGIEPGLVAGQVRDQVRAVPRSLVGLPEAVEFEPHTADAVDTEDLPQPRQHDDQFGIDIRTGEADRLDVDLVELPVAPALRPLVAEHRTHRPYAPRRVVGEVVFDDRTNHAGGELGAQGQALAVELVLEGVHLLLDDVGDLANAAHEELRVFDDRRADLLVAVTAQPVGDARFEPLPQWRIGRQQVVHAAHAGKFSMQWPSLSVRP